MDKLLNQKISTAKNLKASLLAAAGAIAMLATPAHAELLLRYDFGTSSGRAETVAATPPLTSGVTASVLGRGAVFTPSGRDIVLNSDRGAFATETGHQSSNLSAALSAGAYATFSIAPTAGNALSLSSIDVATFTQTADGLTFNVVFSLDNNNFSDPAKVKSVGTINPVSAGWSGATTTFDLTGVAELQSITGTTEFRIAYYGGGQYYQLGFGQIAGANNDIALNGTVAPVAAIPEPSTAAMLGGLGAIAFAATIRRRKA